MRLKAFTLLTTTLLAISAQTYGQSVDIEIGLDRSREFSEVFEGAAGASATLYDTGEAIKISADGTVTTTVSSGLSNALSTVGVNGRPNNSSQTEIGVIGFSAKGNNYFAILQIDGHIDGVSSTIGIGSGKLGVAGNTINALGESLNLKVTDILDDQGNSITLPPISLAVDDVARFIYYTTGNATASEKLEVYVNGNVGTIGGTTPPITGYDYLGNATFPTSPTPVTQYRVRRPGNGNVTFRYTTLQFVTTNFPQGNVEITGYETLTNVDGGYEVNPNYANASAVITYLDANVTSATISDTSDTVAITGWTETGTYSTVAGSYTFTGTLDTANYPPGYVDNLDQITSVEVEVVINSGAPDVNITSADLADGAITVNWEAITGVTEYVVEITKGDLTTFDYPATAGTSQVITFADLGLASAVDPNLSNKGFDPVFLPITVRAEDGASNELSNSSTDTSFTVNGQNRSTSLNATYLGKTGTTDYLMIGSNYPAGRNCAIRMTAQNVDGNKVYDNWIKRTKNESPFTNVIYQLPDTDPNYDEDFNVLNAVNETYRDLTWKDGGAAVVEAFNEETVTLNFLVRDNKANSTGTQQNSTNGKLWIDWNRDGDFDDAGELIESDYQVGCDLNDDGILVDDPVTATAIPNWLELYSDDDDLGPMPVGTINANTTGYYAQSTLANLTETSATKTPVNGRIDMDGWKNSFVYDAYNDVIRVLVDSSGDIVGSARIGNPLWIKRPITVPVGVSAGRVRARMRYSFTNSATSAPANPASFDQQNADGPIYDFEIEITDTPTPARDVVVTQTGKEVRWTVGEEFDVKEYRLVDSSGNIIQVIQAEGLGEYIVYLDELIEVELQVVGNDDYIEYYPPEDGNVVTAKYDLKSGWNLIATIGTDSNLNELIKVQQGLIWGWNGQYYERTEAQEANQGIWVYVTEDILVRASSIKADSTKTLEIGWNLVGPSNSITAPTNVDFIFTWDPQGTKYLENYNTISKGVGYWMFTDEVVDVQMDTVEE